MSDTIDGTRLSGHCAGCRQLPTSADDPPCPGVREHSDEWCSAIERERLNRIADLEARLTAMEAEAEAAVLVESALRAERDQLARALMPDALRSED